MLSFCCHKGHQSGKKPLFMSFFKGMKSFPLAPENCDLNNFVWAFLLILSGVFRLSIKYGLSRFLLSLCCHKPQPYCTYLFSENQKFLDLQSLFLNFINLKSRKATNNTHNGENYCFNSHPPQFRQFVIS